MPDALAGAEGRDAARRRALPRLGVRFSPAQLLAAGAALVTQAALVAFGVYLGLQADQWRDERAHRDAARTTLANFRAELRKNEAAVRARLPYHRELRDSLATVYRRPVRSLAELQRRIQFRGSRGVDFAHTAYDLALSDQALAYLPRDLAFAVSDVYLRQQAFEKLQDAYMQAVYQPTTFDERNVMPFARSLGVYMGDVVSQEPALLDAYAALLPRLDSALARAPK